MSASDLSWQITGDYLENCNCDVLCLCLFSPSAVTTEWPNSGQQVVGGSHCR